MSNSHQITYILLIEEEQEVDPLAIFCFHISTKHLQAINGKHSKQTHNQLLSFNCMNNHLQTIIGIVIVEMIK